MTRRVVVVEQQDTLLDLLKAYARVMKRKSENEGVVRKSHNHNQVPEA